MIPVLQLRDMILTALRRQLGRSPAAGDLENIFDIRPTTIEHVDKFYISLVGACLSVEFISRRAGINREHNSARRSNFEKRNCA